jgi:SAM-dependent methyltransferase
MTASSAAASQTPAQPDLAALKVRQQGAWSSGDYAVVGTTLQIVGEELCEALDLRSGQKVLDVAAGNGNATLAAARRWCDVVSTDYVPSLLERGRSRAAADGLSIEFKEADAEALSFADASFDAVVSTFGVMFTPDQDKAAAELIRVCKRGGKIGLANWTPEGFIGQLFKTSASICRRRPARNRRRCGGPRPASSRCSELPPLPSRPSGAISTSATVRPSISSRSSKAIMARCSRPSRRSTRRTSKD